MPGLSRQAQGGKGAWHFPAAVAMQLEMGVGHLPQLPVFSVTGWRSLTTEELCETCFLFFGSNWALMAALGSSSGQRIATLGSVHSGARARLGRGGAEPSISSSFFCKYLYCWCYRS